MNPRRDDQADFAEVRQALEMTTERMSIHGRSWCPARTGAFLTREMLSLGYSLPGFAQRAVRLARVLEHLGQREGYVGALYRMPALTAMVFSDRLQRGQARLDGIAEVDDANLYLIEEAMGISDSPMDSAGQALETEQSGVVMTEGVDGDRLDDQPPPSAGNVLSLPQTIGKARRQPRSREQPAHFILRLSSLPGIAAYLDMAHNMLGYATVTALLDPVTRPAAGQCKQESVRLVGRELSKAVDSWLRARLESQHAMRQGAEIRKFLHVREAERAGDGSVDNGAILAFWQSYAPMAAPPVDGFIQFRSVARLMLGFRRAQRLAMLEAEHPAYAASVSESAPDPFEAAGEAFSFDTFHSPLVSLADEPSCRVNWLTGTRQELLSLWLDMPGSDDGEPTFSLFAGDPPSEEFAITAVRAAVFGAQQSLLIRNGSTADESRSAGGDRPMDYQSLNESFVRLLAEADETAACAAHHLLGRQLPEVVALAEALWPEALAHAIEAVAARATDLLHGTEAKAKDLRGLDALAMGLQSGDGDASLARLEAMAERLGLSSELRTDLLGGFMADLSQALDTDARRQMSNAKRKVRRAGLTDASLADPKLLAGLATGAPEFARLLVWIRRVSDAVGRVGKPDRFDGDREVFCSIFAQLYPDAPTLFCRAPQ